MKTDTQTKSWTEEELYTARDEFPLGDDERIIASCFIGFLQRTYKKKRDGNTNAPNSAITPEDGNKPFSDIDDASEYVRELRKDNPHRMDGNETTQSESCKYYGCLPRQHANDCPKSKVADSRPLESNERCAFANHEYTFIGMPNSYYILYCKRCGDRKILTKVWQREQEGK